LLPPEPGRIVLLNGAPRSGTSSIARTIQASFDEVWMNLGVDVFAREVRPELYPPGIWLRSGVS
jgi:chloramphenicol 3-O phosphotransferase